jgi:hypothetical protein
MDPVCPRCQTNLSPQARFCPECGAPQLTVEAVEPEPDEASSSGSYSLNGPQIAWPTAIRMAALLSLPTGVLSSLLSFSSLWVVAGGVWTVTLYRRRTLTRINPSLGSRIGCVFGVFAAVVSTLVDAVNLLVTRYGLHRGAEVDSRLHTAMQAGIDRVLASNPDAAHQIPWFFQFWLSPDGQAGLALASAILSAGSMLGFSALGGALGARYFGIRRS